jgi:2-methylisocitrate lyase-like PEP mutase family enzyme
MADATAAEILRSLHVPGRPVVLPNAWDVTSARSFEKAGFPALATSSSAIAHSLGYPDGEHIAADEMLGAVARICRSVSVPVTADLERGYGLEPAELVTRLLEAGAVGCNLEDSEPGSGRLVDRDAQADWLRALRAAADANGVAIVVNARVDVHLHEWGEPGQRLPETIERCRAYLAAGADCVYPIGLADLGDIEELTRSIGGPVNIVFRPDGPSVSELAGAGVARVTFGGGLHIAMRARLATLAQLIRDGRDPYTDPTVS